MNTMLHTARALVRYLAAATGIALRII